MYKHFIWFTLLIAVCSLAVWAGVNPQKGKATTDVSKIKQARDRVKDPAKCPSPRPKDRGCKIPCKPCQIAVCEDGKWVYEKVDWPKEECERPPPFHAVKAAMSVPSGGQILALPSARSASDSKRVHHHP
jgi:hypothetical protein